MSSLEPVLASLGALQSQFTTFQHNLGNVDSDVKHALAQLRALRAAQTETDKSVAELGALIGAISSDREAGRGNADPPADNTLVTRIQDETCERHTSIHRENEPYLIVSSSSRQLSTLQPSTLQPTSHSDPSLPPSIPGKEYTDVSIQVSTSESSSSYGRTSVFTSADWNVDSAVLARNLLLPTSSTAMHHANPSNAMADGQASRRDNVHSLHHSDSRLPTHMISTPSSTTPYSRESQTPPIAPPTASDPSDALFVPGAELAPHIQSLPQTVATQTSLLQTCLSSSPSDRFAPPNSPLSPLISVGEDQIPVSNLSVSLGQRVEAARVASDFGCSNMSNIHPSETLPTLSNCQQTEADEELPSGLPTPPSETSTDTSGAGMANCLTLEHEIVADRLLDAYVSLALIQGLPTVPTPPRLTPEPSMQRASRQVGRGSLSGVSNPLLPLSPLSPPPCPPPFAADGHMSSSDVTPEVNIEESGSGLSRASLSSTAGGHASLGRVAACVVGSDTVESVPAVVEASAQVTEDSDLFMTPDSSAEQITAEPHKCYLDTDAADSDGHTVRFSSPLHPLAPTSTSRYATPFDTSNPFPVQEEDEVWSALMLGVSSMSTPVPDYSRSLVLPARASPVAPGTSHSRPTSIPKPTQQTLAVNPLMLHDPQLLPRDPDMQSLSPLSELTLIDDSDGEKYDPSCGAGARANATSEAESINVDRGSLLQAIGGPSASLNELALLARRDPLKILLKVPKRVQKLKRKRETIGGGVERKVNEDRTAAHRYPEVGESIVKQRQVGGKVMVPPAGASTKTKSHIVTVIPPPRLPRRTVPQATQENLSIIDSMVDVEENLSSEIPVSPARKKPKKRDELKEKEARTVQTSSMEDSIHQNDVVKRRLKAKSKSGSRIKYHVWNGQIVSVELDPRLASKSSTSIPEREPQLTEEVPKDRTPTRAHHHQGQESSALRTQMLSPTKEEVWNKPHESDGKWPELPVSMGSWELQFILCDDCDKWYHYGCVGICPGDPRLEPAIPFICSACQIPSARQQTPQHQGDACARYDCPNPQITDEAEMYYVDKLVGRKKVEDGSYLWLAKWEGYPMTQATWIPRENVVGEGTRLFDDFSREAFEEGADLSQAAVLLQEALGAGLVA